MYCLVTNNLELVHTIKATTLEEAEIKFAQMKQLSIDTLLTLYCVFEQV